jgi:hypothetical protein
MNYMKKLVSLALGEITIVGKLAERHRLMEETVALAMLETGKDKQTVLNDLRLALIAKGTNKQTASDAVKRLGYVPQRGSKASAEAANARSKAKVKDDDVAALVAAVKKLARTNEARKAILRAALALL